MAKRRIINRLSKNPFSSKFLNSDSDIIDEEQTLWWNNLDENMSSQRSSISSILNTQNNTTLKQLSLNSELNSDDNLSEWWKHLESLNDQTSPLRKSRGNLSAVLKKTYLFETTDSETEKESNLIKKKVLLKGRSRKSISNAFSNVLNDTENLLTKNDSLEKISKRKTMISDDQSSHPAKSGQNLSAELKKKTHLFETTDSGSEKEKEPNLLKKKVLLRGRSRKSISNAFSNALNDTENILTKDDSLKKISRRETLISDDQSSHSAKSEQNLSARLKKKTHLFETTDSGSEKEKQSDLLKKKVLLRGRSRKSISNAFSNALNDTENILTKDDNLKISTKKTLISDHDQSFHSAKSEQNLSAGLKKKTHLFETTDSGSEKEKQSDLLKKKVSLRGRSRKSDSANAFLNALNYTEFSLSELLRRSGGVRDQNVFQNTLMKNDSLEKTSRRKTLFEKKSSTSSMQNIDANKDRNDDQRKEIQLSQTLENNEAGPSNLSSSKVVIENTAVSDINEAVENDESEIEINNPKRFKFKSYLMQRAQKSTENNFEDVLAKNRDLNLSEHNQDKEILDPKSLLTTISLSSSRKSINRSKQKIDSTYENASPILRSLRSFNLSEHNQDKETDISDPKSPLKTNSLSSPSRKSVNRSKQKIDSTYENSASLKPSILRSLRSFNLSEHNQDKETDISDPKSPLKTNSLSSPSRKSINKSKQKIDVTYESAFLKSPIRKSIRSLRADEPSTSNVQNLTTFRSAYAEKYEEIKAEVARDMAAMKMEEEKKAALKAENRKLLDALPKKQPLKPPKRPKVVNKAYLVNGKIWKPPPLPRPKHWATNHLYKFLWKRMEPKYQLSTRVRSEKFIVQLAKIVSHIQRCKKYESYKSELEALMKEMARLNIINTRAEFHHFCQDFMPYEFRIKVIPMLLPGNIRNIPFKPEELNIPLLQ